MLERSTRMRLAAAATALALAAPVWATEIQMKKRDDPKQAQSASGQPAQDTKQDPDKKDGDEAKPKKNCPTDNAFNTLEDLFGAVGSGNPLATLPLQADPTQAAVASPASAEVPAVIEWRDVVPAEPARKDEAAESAESGESKPAKQD